MKPSAVKYAAKKLNAVQGMLIWHQIISGNPEIGNTQVILMTSPPSDRDSQYAIQYLQPLLKRTGRKNAVVLTDDPAALIQAEKLPDKIVKVISLSKKKIDQLLCYAALTDFDNRLVIASSEEPYGRFGNRLVGLNGLTEEEVFAIGVYKLPSGVALRHGRI